MTAKPAKLRRKHAPALDGQGRGRAGRGDRAPGSRAPPARAGRLPSRAGRGALLPAAGSRACCPPDGRPGPAPAAGSTGGQHPPCAGAPAAPRSSSHQQRRQPGCSRTVPFTELSRLIGKGTITGISPDSTTTQPPKKGRGC